MTVGRQTPEAPDLTARRGRLAVGGLFLVNGFCYTNVVPWLPTIKSELALSNTELGTAVAAMPLGALLTGLLAGPLIARLGSGRAAVASGVLLSLTPPLAALAPGWSAFALVLFVLGCADAWMDAAMNAHGLRVQRRYRRSIINTFHAGWSVAAVCGGLLGASMAGLGVPMAAHLTVVAALCLVLTLAATRGLLPGPEDAERGDAASSRGAGRPARPQARAVLLLIALSVLLMMAGGIEDSAASWGAVYARDELDASAFVAGLPFVACQAMMTLARLAGDRLTDRFGAVAVARAGALLAAAGLGTALLLPGTATAIAGFGAVGLGIATLFPLTLAAAGSVPGVRSGYGVAVVGWLGRLGFLAFPPLVGMIADVTSLGVGLWVVPAGGIVAAVLATALRAPASRRGR